VVQSSAPSKADLVEALKSSGTDAVETLRALPESAFGVGCYENGWTGREVLAHIASIEWTYQNLLRLAEETAGQPPKAKEEPARPATGSIYHTESGQPTGKILSYNDRQVAKRAGMSVAELIDEFEANRRQTIAAVAAADEELLSREVRSAGGIKGTAAQVLNMVAIMHVQGHVADIVRTAQSG
jgi:hypothetical protein